MGKKLVNTTEVGCERWRENAPKRHYMNPEANHGRGQLCLEFFSYRNEWSLILFKLAFIGLSILGNQSPNWKSIKFLAPFVNLLDATFKGEKLWFSIQPLQENNLTVNLAILDSYGYNFSIKSLWNWKIKFSQNILF